MENVVILDASVAIKAILPNPLLPHCQALIQTFARVRPVAPALWGHETTSAISKAVHFGQLTADEGRQALGTLALLDVHLLTPEAEQNLAAFEWTLRLKRGAAYDCYCLALAETLNCDFWTADNRLFNALRRENLPWLCWIGDMPLDEANSIND